MEELYFFAACSGRGCTGPLNLDISGWFVAAFLLVVYFGAFITANEKYSEGQKGEAFVIYGVIGSIALFATILLIKYIKDSLY